MLIAHLVPGYFAAIQTQPHWQPEWGKTRHALLWGAAFASTFVPDLDVIYNVLFRGFFNHSTLWTHSLFPHLGLAVLWWVLYRFRRFAYLRMLVGLAALGGLSHLLLDVISHGTPLFYPLSLVMVGAPSERV
ncbi:MAG: metal-dependent hydrolase, partial [bacterium]|nr:metal-dependent hydrolase [bacterium]